MFYSFVETISIVVYATISPCSFLLMIHEAYVDRHHSSNVSPSPFGIVNDVLYHTSAGYRGRWIHEVDGACSTSF